MKHLLSWVTVYNLQRDRENGRVRAHRSSADLQDAPRHWWVLQTLCFATTTLLAGFRCQSQMLSPRRELCRALPLPISRQFDSLERVRLLLLLLAVVGVVVRLYHYNPLYIYRNLGHLGGRDSSIDRTITRTPPESPTCRGLGLTGW